MSGFKPCNLTSWILTIEEMKEKELLKPALKVRNTGEVAASTSPGLLIGLTGVAGCGKDTVARLLGEMAGFERVAFADKLKELIAFSYGHPVESVESEKSNPLIRRLLQRMGAGVREIVGLNAWIDAASGEIVGRLNDGYNVVVSDVRYDNEAEYIRALGGKVVGIDRDGAGLAGDLAEHPSEAGVSPHLVDFVLHNHGDENGLRESLETLLNCV